MQDKATFGQWLRERRKTLDLTQEEVAQRAGCAVDTVRKLEAGSRRASKEVAHSLADAFALVGAERAAFLRLARGAPGEEPPAQREPVPLLATKLYLPRLHTQFVARPRLRARLEAALSRPLTLIAAPAGFGKTTLLADWLSSTPAASHHVTWLALDAGDADPIHFLRYLITALQKLSPAIGATILPLLQATQPPPLELLLPVLVNDLTQVPEGSLLILDDYHVIDAAAIHHLLTFLLDHLPPQLHLVIATRVDPPLPLARLRARGQLVEVRAADLRFTTEEAAAFLHEVMGLHLSAIDIAAIEARTEGWIAGLQLAALSLQHLPSEQVSTFIDSFAGSHRFVVDYLADEVLASQPVEVQIFLLHTSILDRFCAPLCDVVVGTTNLPSQSLLQHLERANLFLVALDETRRWYRYHHLFAQVLQERLLASTTAEEVATLHRRAAAWFEEQGLIVEAVRYALAAQDWEGAASLIQAHGWLLYVQGHRLIVQEWLNLLPEALLRARPYLLDLQTYLFYSANELEAAERTMQAAEAALPQDATDEDIRTIRGSAALLRVHIALARGDLARCVELSGQALAYLPQGQMLRRAAATMGRALIFRVTGDVGPTNEQMVTNAVAMIRNAGSYLTLFISSTLSLAEFYKMQGRLRQAAISYRKANQIAPQLFTLRVLNNAARFYFGLGEVLYEGNELDAAEHFLRQGQEIIQRRLQAHGDVITNGYITIARLQQARGNHEAARTTLHELQALTQEHGFATYLAARGKAAAALIALQQDDLASAVRWADASDLLLEDAATYLREQEYLILAQVRMMQGHRNHDPASLTTAVYLLGQLLTSAEAARRDDSVIHILTLHALALQTQGEQTAALQNLGRAIELAAPEGYVRVFVDVGSPLAQLLKLGLRSAFVAPGVRRYAEMLLDVMEREARTRNLEPGLRTAAPDSPLLGESLTARELEVLRLLVAGSSNQAIARALVVELGTVKRHVSNLMAKLQVQSRLEAVVRARDLGIV